ncbi:MAG: undecaprenyl-diphosphatase UppP [Actinobacteria bacterium]|nr:undecaprenyl-diphosphatase UppP [Actinomycetota bacterium]
MSPIQAFVLGIVQGLTEFAPVSSSAHLVLVPWLLRWPEPGLAFDTVLHLGTLLAVVIYFAQDIARLAAAWFRSLLPPFRINQEASLAWLLVLATIPAALAGLLLKDWFEAMFAAPATVGGLLLLTALLLLAADRWAVRMEAGYPRSPWKALLIGLAQAVAIAPGVSRSGATISAGMLMGLSRTAAARFSFLLSVPIILGAGATQSLHIVRSGNFAAQESALAIGLVAAALTGYLCIRFLLAYLGTHNLKVFAGYCLLLGVSAIAVASLRG